MPQSSKHFHGQGFEKANAVRIERAKMRRRVNARMVSVYELLENSPAFLDTLPVLKLLTWQPKVGLIKARWVMVQAGLDGSTRMGALGPKGRQRLIDELRIQMKDVTIDPR